VKFEFYFIGKTTEKYLQDGIEQYARKLGFYVNTSIKFIPASTEKNMNRALQEERDKMLKTITPQDFVVVLDERGKQFSSMELATEIQRILNRSLSRVVFIIGSAYGIDEEIKKRANLILSFSKFTLTHQMIRLVLLEQVYRSMTILKGESYHHE
jgi:23S rRNA (pseudouridine1915-N3)-methyltransferase